jgi:hypothetical protein
MMWYTRSAYIYLLKTYFMEEEQLPVTVADDVVEEVEPTVDDLEAVEEELENDATE